MKTFCLFLCAAACLIAVAGCSSDAPPAVTGPVGPTGHLDTLEPRTVAGSFDTAEEAALAALIALHGDTNAGNRLDQDEALRLLAAQKSKYVAGPNSFRDDGGQAFLFQIGELPYKVGGEAADPLHPGDWAASRLWPQTFIVNDAGWALVTQQPDGRWRVVEYGWLDEPHPLPTTRNGWHDVTREANRELHSEYCDLGFYRFDGAAYKLQWSTRASIGAGWDPVPIPMDLVRERLAARLGSAPAKVEVEGSFAFQSRPDDDDPPQLLLQIGPATADGRPVDLMKFSDHPANIFLYARQGAGWRLIFEGLDRSGLAVTPNQDKETGDILVPIWEDDEMRGFVGNYRIHDGKVVESPWEPAPPIAP
jgi:hypothetical protein